MSMCRVFSCVVGRGCLLLPVRSLGKTVLVFALLHSVFQRQICMLFQVFLDFLLLHFSSLKWKGHLFWVLVLKGLTGLHRTIQVQLPLFDHFQFALIHGPNISGSYAMLFFTASRFTFSTRHTHSWALFLLCHFIGFGASSKCPLLLPSSISDSFQSDGLIFHCHIFFLFILLMGFLGQEYWSVLPFPPPVDHVLLELFTMTCPALLTASLNCASHFAMARQWSTKWGN